MDGNEMEPGEHVLCCKGSEHIKESGVGFSRLIVQTSYSSPITTTRQRGGLISLDPLNKAGWLALLIFHPTFQRLNSE